MRITSLQITGYVMTSTNNLELDHVYGDFII